MKTTLTTTILLLFTQFCFSQPAKQEQDDFWVGLEKPTQDMVFSLAVNSITEVYAGTVNGVYLTNNDSNSWILTGLEGITSYSLHVHSNGNVFAGTGGFNTIYRLNNFDEDWTPVFSCISNIISFASSSNNDIFAGSGGDYGVLRSTNNGDDWEQLLTLTDTEQTNAILPFGNNQVFIGTTDFMGGGGVYRSMDNGDTWEHVGLHNEYISSLAINSTGVLFAGSRGHHEYSRGGVFRSVDNGITWEEVAINVLVTSMVIDPNDVLYIGCTLEHGGQGGVFRSLDNGDTWELIVTGMGVYLDVDGLSLSPDGYLYAYSRWTLHRSVEPVFEAVYSVSATAIPFEGGEVSGTGEYTHGQTATLTATANEGNTFVNWTDTLGVVLSTETVYSFSVASNIKLFANFEFTNSIQQHSFSDINVYPNPFIDILNVVVTNEQLGHNSLSIKVFNSHGRLVLAKSLIIPQNKTINLSSLPPGLYFISIEIKGEKYTKPILKVI